MFLHRVSTGVMETGMSWNVRENEMGSWKAWNVRENELGVMENNLGEKIKILSTEFFSMLENVEIICF